MEFNSGSHATVAIYIRVVALSIGFYDYLLTLPAERLLYRSQKTWRLSPGCILFISIRYVSLLVLILSNVGYFGHFFSEESCARYHMIPPVLKVVQTMVSQLILGVRTINISRRAPRVLWSMIVAFVLTSIGEGFFNLANRVPLQGWRSNCMVGDKPPRLTVWLFYVCAMLYDVIALSISSVYLIDVSPSSIKMGRLVNSMLRDGLVYFVALTGANVLNLILYRNKDEVYQSSGVTLGYTLTWVMSQRILIRLREAAAEHDQTQIVASHQLPSDHSISQAISFQFKARSPLSSAFELEDRPYTSFATGDRVSTPGTDGKTSRSSYRNSHPVNNESQNQDPETMRPTDLNDKRSSKFQLDARPGIKDKIAIEYTSNEALTSIAGDAAAGVGGMGESEGQRRWEVVGDIEQSMANRHQG